MRRAMPFALAVLLAAGATQAAEPVVERDVAVPMRLRHGHGFKNANAKAAKGAGGGIEMPFVFGRYGGDAIARWDFHGGSP